MAICILGPQTTYMENGRFQYLSHITCECGLVKAIRQHRYMGVEGDTTRRFRMTTGEDMATSILGLKTTQWWKNNLAPLT